MNLLEATFSCIRKTVNISGRATRSEFWYFATTVFIYFRITTLFLEDYTVTDPIYIVHTIISGILNAALSSVIIRRLHDIGKSGWSQLIILTGVGSFLFVYWLTFPSESLDNQYGKHFKNNDISESELGKQTYQKTAYNYNDSFFQTKNLNQTIPQEALVGIQLKQPSINKPQRQLFGKRK